MSIASLERKIEETREKMARASKRGDRYAVSKYRALIKAREAEIEHLRLTLPIRPGVYPITALEARRMK